MINRRLERCISCKSLTLTRTQIGHKDLQAHSFPCGTCGIEISFELELDQKNAGLKYRRLKNATWVDSDPEKPEDHMVYLSDEILFPVGTPQMMSPFIAGFALYEDFEAYRMEEAQRQLLVRRVFDYLARCTVHFRRGNLKLFDKEAKFRPKRRVTNRERLQSLYSTYTASFKFLTSNCSADIQRVNDRIETAIRRERPLVQEIADELISSGKMSSLATEIESVRKSMVEAYPFLQPLFQLRYWKKEHQMLREVKLTDKRFDVLQQLYVKCFETLCRLAMVGLSIEAAIANGKLEINAKKRYVPIAEIWQMANATKVPHFQRFPVLNEFFVPVIDTTFRNGIGHHSAHYVAESDDIVITDSRGSGAVIQRISYTEFCDKLLKLFSAFELGVLYFQALHAFVDGRYAA